MDLRDIVVVAAACACKNGSGQEEKGGEGLRQGDDIIIYCMKAGRVGTSWRGRRSHGHHQSRRYSTGPRQLRPRNQLCPWLREVIEHRDRQNLVRNEMPIPSFKKCMHDPEKAAMWIELTFVAAMPAVGHPNSKPRANLIEIPIVHQATQFQS